MFVRGTGPGAKRTGAANHIADVPTVSADFLRNPISPKTRRMLKQAEDSMLAGKHESAIQQLEEMLAKDPVSAPYVHSLLGYEYMQTKQFTAAVKSLEHAVLLLPRDASNHTNLGISLAAVGEYHKAEEEARRARQLAPDNPRVQLLFTAITNHNRAK